MLYIFSRSLSVHFNLHFLISLLQCEYFFLYMLSKSSMFRLMNMRMRILSPPPPPPPPTSLASAAAAAAAAAAAVGVFEGRRGDHITLRLPTSVDESSLSSPNGKILKHDFLGHRIQCMICVAFLFCLFWFCCFILFHVNILISTTYGSIDIKIFSTNSEQCNNIDQVCVLLYLLPSLLV